MARIPTIQRQFIPKVAESKDRSGVIESAMGFAGDAIKVGNAYKQAYDTTKVNEEYAKFQGELNTEFEQFKRDNASNPEGFAEKWDKFYNEKKKTYIDNNDLSRSAKKSLDEVLTIDGYKNQSKVVETQRELQLNSYAGNIEKAAISNNMMSYTAGQNLDMSSLDKSEKIIRGNIIAGSTIMSPEKLEKSARVQTQGVYENFIKGVASTDLDVAKRLVEDKEIQKKLVDIETVDSLRDYIRKIENREEQLRKDALAEEKRLKKAALDVDVQATIESEFNKFNIGQKDGMDVIKNSKFNSMEELVNFREDVKNAKNKNQITDEQYLKYMSDTNPVMVGMIQKGKIGDKRSIFVTTVNEQIGRDIKKKFKNNPEFDDAEFASIYEETYKQLKSKGISLSSVSSNDKLEAQNLLNQNISDFVSLRAGRSDINAAIIGNSVIPVNSEAKTKGKELDNGGYILMTDDFGNKAYVLKDSSGKVIDVKEVK